MLVRGRWTTPEVLLQDFFLKKRPKITLGVKDEKEKLKEKKATRWIFFFKKKRKEKRKEKEELSRGGYRAENKREARGM